MKSAAVYGANASGKSNLIQAIYFMSWFVEKDQYGATDLYSLVEYELFNDIRFEENYIKGRYGAIPFIGDLRTVIVK